MSEVENNSNAGAGAKSSRQDFLAAADALLRPKLFKDYCPNGLQVQGREDIAHVVCGVTASEALIRAAIELGADALLVHHGYFWRGEPAAVTGAKYQRLRLLIENGINLFAYHLPLDAHPQLGNNARLADILGISVTGGLDGSERPIGNVGELNKETDGAQFAALLEQKLARAPLHIDSPERGIRRLGWCTGAAQEYLGLAIEQGLDAYITGEISEQSVHEAREAGIHLFAAGHHATERYGVQALCKELAQQLGFRWQFIDIDNPV